MQVKVYNQIGQEIGQARLPKEVFGLKMNPDLVHQVQVGQAANRRQNTAQTKDRAQVRGGGRKPWRQKGTGRARHGSRRSPLWKGGGVTFGPTNERNFKQAIPSKMRKQAALMVLSSKAKENQIILLDELKAENIKTKPMANLMSALPIEGDALILLSDYDKKTVLSFRNLPGVFTMEARELNALDLLNHKYVIMPKESIKIIEKIFLKKQK